MSVAIADTRRRDSDVRATNRHVPLPAQRAHGHVRDARRAHRHLGGRQGEHQRRALVTKGTERRS
eukprot:3128994-Prymnesium_polylepis.1